MTKYLSSCSSNEYLSSKGNGSDLTIKLGDILEQIS